MMTHKKINFITEISAVTFLFIGILYIVFLLAQVKILSFIFGGLLCINLIFIIYLFILSEIKHRKFVKDFWG